MVYLQSTSAKQKLDEDLEEIAIQVNPKEHDGTAGSEVKSSDTSDNERPSEKMMRRMPVVSV